MPWRGCGDGAFKVAALRGESEGGVSTQTAYFPLETVVVHERTEGERQHSADVQHDSDGMGAGVALGADDCSSESYKPGSSVRMDDWRSDSSMEGGVGRGRWRELASIGGREGRKWGTGAEMGGSRRGMSSGRSGVAKPVHPTRQNMTPYIREGWEQAEDGEEIGDVRGSDSVCARVLHWSGLSCRAKMVNALKNDVRPVLTQTVMRLRAICCRLDRAGWRRKCPCHL